MSDAFNARIAKLSPQQLQLLAIDLRARLDRVQDERREPIAVVGVGCRFPGADGPEAFWKLVSTGQDVIREIPAERWNADEYFDPDPDARGTMATRWGGFLDRVDQFDPEFFGIAPREAYSIDPQQRLLLEVTWEALEHAGVAPDRLRGSKTGVFVGMCSGDYFQLSLSRGYESIDTYLATGGSHSVASGRLSYILGLEGPALSIDTACSSSLMAVHLAARSLRSGECRMALAAGVNAILWPGSSIAMSRGRMMAPDGRCKPFDARGDGFVRSEGCGVVVLKRLSDAIADGDRVLALIRGTAANQDGRSNGLTAPNGRAQAAVIADALADGGLQPAAVSYVEAHGTGTPLGDPIEMHALGAALSPGRDARDRVFVGSVKSNVGHLEGAAGMAGIIKTILMLQAQRIPPSLHFEQPNPFIDWASVPLDVPTALVPWEPRQGRRVAGVSSFGFSGSNAHIVLEEATSQTPPVAGRGRTVSLLPLSARTAPALRQLAGRYAQALASDPSISLADVALTAGAGRAHFDHRTAFVVRNREELVEQLRGLADDRQDATALQGQLASSEAPRVAFLFTGQGSQYVGMGATLARTEPVFRAALERCAAVLDPMLPSPLLATMHAADVNDRRIHNTLFTQPAMLAIQFALAELWRSWGVVPSAVMGHSLGEYAAACVAGVMSIEDALPLVAARARLMQSAPGEGAMLAAFAHGDVVREHLRAYPNVSVAAFNGPDNTVLSGPRPDVERIEAALVAAGIEVRALQISHAFHSKMVDPVLDEFERAVARASLRMPQLNLISNLTGAVADDSITRTTYWRRHLREPVRFVDGMAQLVGMGTRLFVEIGPHPSLIAMARRYTSGEGIQWLASMRRDRDDAEQMTETLGALYTQGVPVDWKAYGAPDAARKVALPTYPFQRETYWIDVSTARASAAGASAPAGLPGRRVDVAHGPVVFDGAIALSDLPWLDSHRIGGAMMAPAPLFVDIARATGAAVGGFKNVEVTDLRIAAPLTVPETGSRRVQTLVERAPDGTASVEILSQEPDGAWTSHVRCQLREMAAPLPSLDATAATRCTTTVDVAAHYARLEALGVSFGPELRRLSTLAHGSEEAVATVSIIAAASATSAFHPAVVDGCLHALGVCLPSDSEDAYLMVGADRVAFAATDVRGELRVHARLRPADSATPNERVADVWASAPAGAPVALLEGVRLHRTRRPTQANPDLERPERWIYDFRWEDAPMRPVASAAKGQHWLLVGGPAELRASVEQTLVRAGARASTLDLAGADGDALEARVARELDAVAPVGAPTHILHLEGASPADVDPSSADLAARVERVCRSALALARQVVSREWSARVWFVTAGATPATGVSDLAGGALWGFGRTLGNEHPELWGGMVDLDAAADADRARLLVDEIAGGPGEPAVAFAGGRRMVARLGRLERKDGATLRVPALRGDRTYVVTGALGGIGMKVVGWLVERGARHLALLARRAPSAEQTAMLDALRSGGVDVRMVSADVGVDADVAAALNTVRATMPAIAGVLHVAGNYNDAVIERLDWPRMASVLGAKVHAGWSLHRHTRGDALEQFVLFASGASFLGPVGLSNYAAANAGLDALAHLRRAQGLPAVSADWGPWANTGMAEAVGSGRQGQWGQAGFGVMAPAHALAVLGDLMSPGAPAQAAVMPVDWPVFRTAPSGKTPLFAAFDAAGSNAAVKAKSNGRVHAAVTPAALAVLPADERLERLVGFLRVEVARELGVSEDRIALGKPLNALGLDSLMAVQLRNRVQEALQTTIPVSRFIEGPSVRQLGAELLDRLGSVVAPVVTPASPAVEVDGLSDADVERMLLELLNEQKGSA